MDYPKVKMVRYADDMIVHCETEIEAIAILDKITIRMKECNLTVHPEKTKIVYCKKSGREASCQHGPCPSYEP